MGKWTKEDLKKLYHSPGGGAGYSLNSPGSSSSGYSAAGAAIGSYYASSSGGYSPSPQAIAYSNALKGAAAFKAIEEARRRAAERHLKQLAQRASTSAKVISKRIEAQLKARERQAIATSAGFRSGVGNANAEEARSSRQADLSASQRIIEGVRRHGSYDEYESAWRNIVGDAGSLHTPAQRHEIEKRLGLFADAQKRAAQYPGAQYDAGTRRGAFRRHEGAVQEWLENSDYHLIRSGRSDEVSASDRRGLFRQHENAVQGAVNQGRADAFGASVVAALQAKADDGGIWGKVGRVFSPIMHAPGIEQAIDFVTWIGDETLQQAYYASSFSREEGHGTLSQIQAFGSGLPGLGFVAPGGSAARDAVEATNSWEERQELRDQGRLDSFGENVFGDAKIPVVGWRLSGLGDLAFQLATDPFTYTPALVSKAGSISARATRFAARSALRNSDTGLRLSGRIAPVRALRRSGLSAQETIDVLRAGRRGYLRQSRFGRNLLDSLEDVGRIGVRQSPDRIKRSIKGATDRTAQELFDAGVTGGQGGFRRELVDQFARGTLDPRVTVRRQIAGLGTKGAFTARGVPLILGPKFIRQTRSTSLRNTLERWAHGDGLEGTSFRNRSAAQAVHDAQELAMVHTDTPWAVDFHARHVAPEIEGLVPVQRFQRLVDILEDDLIPSGWFDEGDTAALREVFAREAVGLDARAALKGGADELEQHLARLESVVGLLQGKGGWRARVQARSVLTSSIRVNETTVSWLMREAFHRTGLEQSVVLGRKGEIPMPNRSPKGLGRPRIESLPRVRQRLRGATGRRNGAATRFKQWNKKNPDKDPYNDNPYADELIRREKELLEAEEAVDTWYDRALEDIAERHERSWGEFSDWFDERLDIRIENATRRLSGYGPDGFPNNRVNAATLERRITSHLPAELGVTFQASLVDMLQREVDDLFPLLRQVDALVENPRLLEAATRIARDNRALMLKQELATRMVNKQVAGNALLRTRRGFSRLMLSIADSIAPPTIPFLKGANESVALSARVEAGTRWLADLGFDPNTRRWFGLELFRATTERQVYELVRGALEAFARRQGIPEDVLVKHWESQVGEKLNRIFKATEPEEQAWFEAKFGRAVEANVTDEVQLITQLIEDIPIPNADELRGIVRGIRAERARLTSPSGVVRKTRQAGADVLDYNILGADRLTLRRGLRAGHRMWKYAVVTNLPMVFGGALGGALGAEGLEDRFGDGDASGWDRLKWAMFGAGMGSVGSIRYITRVVGIEEKFIRTQLQRGFDNTFLPFVSKFWRRRGVDDPFRLTDNLLQLPTEHTPLHAFMAETQEWLALAPKHPRFLDGWWRVVNYQIRPETDQVMSALLRGRAGVQGLSPDMVRVHLKHYLTKDPEGIIHMQRMRGAVGGTGPKNVDELLRRYDDIIDSYLPDDDLVRLRLEKADSPDALITRGELKTFLKEGRSPQVVHAQDTWRLPRTPGQLYESMKQVMPRHVLERPTATIARIPMAESIYRDEYLRLTRMGLDGKVAREYAESTAVDITNSTMFKLSDESRFAAKVDAFAPFQQPREEMVRVYAGLAMNNPARTLRMTRMGAVVLNNGKENGTFYKDELTGEWVMRVPGSAWLSRVLGGGSGAEDFEFAIRDAFFLLQGADGLRGGDFNLHNMTTFGEAILPRFGGPYWSVVTRLGFNAFPGLHERLINEHGWLYDFLFPYGTRGFIFRPEARRLWAGLTGSMPPWEFASSFEQENELQRYQQEIFLQMLRDHRRENPDDLDWVPNPLDVKRATADFFLTWALIGSVVPASSRPKFEYGRWLDEIQEDFQDSSGKLDFSAFAEAHPEAVFFLTADRTRDVGPQTFERWAEEYSPDKRFKEYALHHRDHLGLDAFYDQFEEARQISAHWDEWNNIRLNPNTLAREEALDRYLQENPDFNPNSSYEKVRDLAHILATVPKSRQQAAINRWRQRYDVSYSQYQDLRREAKDFEVNPWAEARDMHDVVADVEGAVRRGFDEDWYVAQLPPAEQIRYINQQMLNMRYTGEGPYGAPANPQAFLDAWNGWKEKKNALYADNPQLTASSSENTKVEQMVEDWQGDYRQTLAGINDRIYNEVVPALEDARDREDWTTYRSLKDERTRLFDLRRFIQNKQYQELPDLDQYQRDLVAVYGWGRANKLEDSQKVFEKWVRGFEEGNVPFMPSQEENTYLQMTPDAQQAYLDDLVNQLNVPPGEFDFHIGDMKTGKLFWAWLTDFQRDLLKRNLPAEMVDEWMMEDPEATYGNRNGRRYGGSGYRYYRRPNYYRYSGRSGNAELDYAYAIFEQYNKRPAGMQEPAAYKQYLELPDDPAIRADFLRRHPEVQEWISLGPMANMPPVLRYLVADIMIRNGRWEGDTMSIGEITELAWAQEQFARFSRRGDMEKPATYDIWLNMPTGPAKAQYLKDHPEVRRWIQLGPMAHMPDAYREVVRDIMIRYGQWTEQQDPLGKTLQEFYRVPRSQREEYLEKHPELEAYFNVLRSPEEQRLHDLASRYFALSSPNSKRFFLASHPELEDFFIESRSRRYERFMNQVAQYMGTNPEMFEQYLDRQEDVLSDIVRRFGTIPLIRERYSVTDQRYGSSRRSESGRARKAA